MSIFGQVWLWSLAAFLVGAVLTWLVLVLPLRKSVRKLESELAQAHADAARTPAAPEAFSRPSYTEPEPEETSYPGTLVAAAPVAHSDVHGDVRSGVHDDIDEDFAELDSHVPPRTAPEPFHADEPHPAATTQYLTPVADPGYQHEDAYEDDDEDDDAEYDDDNEADDDEHDHEDHEYEPAAPALTQLEPSSTAGSLFEPSSGGADWFADEVPQERSAFEEPVERTRYISDYPGAAARSEQQAAEEPEPPQYAFAEDDVTAGDLDVPPETPAEATQVLPKRQPRGTVRGGYDAPQPIQPSMRTVERREPDLTGTHSGSLFEPQVQAGDAADVPPAPPARQDTEDSVPPGPFGPGSAMPRPGGGRPSDGFAVKASVTALRYCAPESTQFPKMVAEVWFRTAEDAERVGFRPLA